MPAKLRSSRTDENCKDKCSAKRWLDASRPPKKRGAAADLRLWSQEGKPWPQRTPTEQRGRRSRLHTALLAMHLRPRWQLCRGRTLGRGRLALHQDGAEALLSAGGGDVVRVHQRTPARAAR